MAPRHPPRFVVRTLDAARERRQRLMLGAAWAASLIVVGTGTWAFSADHVARSATATAPASASASAVRSDTHALQAESDDLHQQVANLQRASQVADIAAKELKRNLGERDEEIAGLRTDLAFYSRLVGGGGQRDGLKVQGARTTPVSGSPHAWNVVVTLTQNARRGEILTGKLAFAIDGIQGNKVATLEGPALGQASASAVLPFSFKYFQQVQGSFTLPKGFQPTRLRLVARVEGSEAINSTVPWADATRTDEANDVQQ